MLILSINIIINYWCTCQKIGNSQGTRLSIQNLGWFAKQSCFAERGRSIDSVILSMFLVTHFANLFSRSIKPFLKILYQGYSRTELTLVSAGSCT